MWESSPRAETPAPLAPLSAARASSGSLAVTLHFAPRRYEVGDSHGPTFGRLLDDLRGDVLAVSSEGAWRCGIRRAGGPAEPWSASTTAASGFASASDRPGDSTMQRTSWSCRSGHPNGMKRQMLATRRGASFRCSSPGQRCGHCAMLCSSSWSPSGQPVSKRRRWREGPHRVASDSGSS